MINLAYSTRDKNIVEKISKTGLTMRTVPLKLENLKTKGGA